MPDADQNQADLQLLRELAAEAGKIGLKWFRKDPQVWTKQGNSPVSEADYAIDQFLKRELCAARPDYGWLSEETPDDRERLGAQRVFVVDPIDGTRGFINGHDQWCVSVAIVEENRPVVGVLECPALGEQLSAGYGNGAYSDADKIVVKPHNAAAPLRMTAPRKIHAESDQLFDIPVENHPFVPSLAYRIALVAKGQVHLCLAHANAKDWDIAAADLIVREAGGALCGPSGNVLQYNRQSISHSALVACSRVDQEKMLDLSRSAFNH